MKKLCQYLLALCVIIGQAEAQTTTVTAETSNNTSASSSFPGLTDFRTTLTSTTPSPWTLGSFIETNPFDSTPLNVSKVNVHSLMDPSFAGKILVETQSWFCNQSPLTSYTRTYVAGQNDHSFPQCGSHLDVLYDSNDQVHADAAVNEMSARGFDGFMADTSGGSTNCRTGSASGTPLSFTFSTPCPAKIQLVDGAISKMMISVNQNHPNQMVFFLTEDSSALDGAENCGTGDLNQALCIAQKIESDISYYNLNYFFPSPNNSAYLKNADGSALVSFFIAEEHQGQKSDGSFVNPIDLNQCDSSACVFENGTTCTGTFVKNGLTFSNCWTAIWDAVRAHAPVPLSLIFRNKGGFTHEQSDGAYAWVDPNPATGTAITAQSQEDWKNGTELDDFYAAAECARPGGTCAGKLVFGIAKKGFDREDAPFQALGLGNVTAQQCGQVWLNSFKEPFASGHFDATHPLPFMLVGTWDDYEEGTEVETGIDNCGRLYMYGETGLVRWDILDNAPDGAGFPSANTIHHYSVYSSTDRQNLSLMKDNISCAATVNCTVDVLPLAANLANGTYTFFVKAVGQPSITNLFAGVTQTLKDFAVHFDATGVPGAGFVSTRPGNTHVFTLTLTTNVPNASISPTTVTSGQLATIVANIPPGEGTWNFTLQATDTTTGASDSVTDSLEILGNPDFSVPILQPSSATVTAGASANFTVNETTSSGFNAPVTFSASGLPDGGTASFSPATLSSGSGSSQLSLLTSDSTPPGTYTITISASDGGLTQTQTATLRVNPPPPPPRGGCTGHICQIQP